MSTCAVISSKGLHIPNSIPSLKTFYIEHHNLLNNLFKHHSPTVDSFLIKKKRNRKIKFPKNYLNMKNKKKSRFINVSNKCNKKIK